MISRSHHGMTSPPEKKLPTDSKNFPILASMIDAHFDERERERAGVKRSSHFDALKDELFLWDEVFRSEVRTLINI